MQLINIGGNGQGVLRDMLAEIDHMPAHIADAFREETEFLKRLDGEPLEQALENDVRCCIPANSEGRLPPEAAQLLIRISGQHRLRYWMSHLAWHLGELARTRHGLEAERLRLSSRELEQALRGKSATDTTRAVSRLIGETDSRLLARQLTAIYDYALAHPDEQAFPQHLL